MHNQKRMYIIKLLFALKDITSFGAFVCKIQYIFK